MIIRAKFLPIIAIDVNVVRSGLFPQLKISTPSRRRPVFSAGLEPQGRGAGRWVGWKKAKTGERRLAAWLIVKALEALNMTAAAQAKYKAKARIIKALAHPTRLFIVEELSRGERCVCELTDMIGVEMPTVSRHLSQLKSVGILEDEKRGAQVFYRLRVPCVLNFFKCVEAVQENGQG